MSLLVTGSIAIDDVKTPCGEVKGVYGGSAVYFSLAAKLFGPVRFVGVVGEDFPPAFRAYLEEQGLDLTGLEVRKGSKTFRWSGTYESVTSDAQTLDIALNVLAEAGPKVPEAYTDSRDVFLAATHPELQADLIRQVRAPRLVVADTRDLWIRSERDALLRTLGMVTGAILNDAEALQLTGENNLVLAGRKILEWGPTFVVIKKGEHGAMLVTRERVAVLPAYPTTRRRDDGVPGGSRGSELRRPAGGPGIRDDHGVLHDRGFQHATHRKHHPGGREGAPGRIQGDAAYRVAAGIGQTGAGRS